MLQVDEFYIYMCIVINQADKRVSLQQDFYFNVQNRSRLQGHSSALMASLNSSQFSHSFLVIDLLHVPSIYTMLMSYCTIVLISYGSVAELKRFLTLTDDD